LALRPAFGGHSLAFAGQALRSSGPGGPATRTTLKLFIELEKVPLSRRDTEAYRDKEDALAWMVGLHAEHRFDAHRVNDRDLINRPPQYDCFQESWEKVLAMREKLLAMAGLNEAH
jgi:hypothetical protein